MNRTLPIQITEIPGPRSRAMASDLRRFESPNITYLAPDFPIFWEKASGCWITDVDGNTYLDMTAAFGVAAVGHCHPVVVEAIRRQAGKLIHGMGDVHPSDVKVRLCEKISASVTPATPFLEERAGERLTPAPFLEERAGERLTPAPFLEERAGERLTPATPFLEERAGERLTPAPFLEERAGERLTPAPFLEERAGERLTPAPFLEERAGERLTPNSPAWRIILGQNGSDAVEAALKTARLATGKAGVIAFEGGYHGLSYGALNVTSRDDFRRPFLDQLGAFVRHLPYGCDVDILDAALAGAGSPLSGGESRGEVGAVIVEPIQGRGGIVVPPAGWLKSIGACARRRGALLILDEIFTGWGRTGEWFAHQSEDATPDILCIGKAMGGGMPISACAAPPSIMSAWGESQGEALHTSTFLGNPLACAAALATIDLIETEGLPERAAAMGALLMSRLWDLCRSFPSMLLSVRGRGLMIGLQTASQPIADRLMRVCLANGLIVLPAGDGSVLEFVPPLVVTESEIDTAVEILGAAIPVARGC